MYMYQLAYVCGMHMYQVKYILKNGVFKKEIQEK
jgi:hypothetical protein